MKVFYATFLSGIGRGQLLHTETGVSIIEDPYAYRVIYAQSIPGKPSGVMDENVFIRGLQTAVNNGEKVLLQVNPENEREGIYVLRNVPITPEIDAGLKKIEAYSAEHERRLRLTEKDKHWLTELVSGFPEYVSSRLEFEPGPVPELSPE